MGNEIPKPRAPRADPDNRLGIRAGRQHGVVGRADARAAGLDKDAVRRRVRAGRLHPMFHGAWSVGHPPITREAWWMAAVLAVGGDARLDGPSACQLYEIFRRRIGRVHLVTSRTVPAHDRLKVRRAKALPPMRRRDGIPVVPVEEALLGLAACPDVTDAEVRKALRRSMTERHTTFDRLKRHVLQAKGRPGVRRLRHLLLDDRAPRSKSALEARAAELLHRYGIPFEQNVEIDGEEADLVAGGVIVELDSEAFHDNPVSAQDDRRRHEVWTANGRATQRWTWDDVHARPVATVRRLTAAIACCA